MASGVADDTGDAGTELRGGGAAGRTEGGGTEGAAIAAAGADGGAIGGGGAEGGRIGSEYAALGIGGGVESRCSGSASRDASSSLGSLGGVGMGKPIKVAACGRMLGMLGSGSDFGSGGGGSDAARAVTGGGTGSGGSVGGATAVIGAAGGSEIGRGVKVTRNG